VLLLGLLILCAPLAHAQGISVIGNLTRESNLQPGGTTSGSLLIHNQTDHPQAVSVYQKDYLFHADGRTEYGDPGSVARSNATWITFAPHQFTLAAGASQPVNYTVQVPANPSLQGTYWSVLMVEPQGDAPPAQTAGPAAISVRQVWRYAVQMITQLGATGTCDLKFNNRALVRDAQKHCHLQFDLENGGERSLSPSVWVEVFAADAHSLGRISGRRIRLYPGCSARVDLDLGTLAPATYHALVVADNGDENVFGAQYELDVN
jgi:hypothetical protein